MNDTKRHLYIDVQGMEEEVSRREKDEVKCLQQEERTKKRFTSCLEVPDSRKEGIHCG